MPLITRFAPSPTGYLHLGHAYSAVFAYEQARAEGGRFLLRVEDIDPTRCRPEFSQALIEDLRWLGLTWEEPVRRQSEHIEDYAAALAKLRTMGLLYPCFCTRREIENEVRASASAPHLALRGPDGPVYPGTCRNLAPDEQAERLRRDHAANWRLDIAKALEVTGPLYWNDRAAGQVKAVPLDFGDVVLARKDVSTSYHLSVTVDDHLQHVTLVTRGKDLFRATDIHRLLQALLGFATPDYYHHELLTDATGRRLAKRDGDVTLRALRMSGRTAAEVRGMVGKARAGVAHS
jgi:glutamyl-Q tRNA(Asp) synthetase